MENKIVYSVVLASVLYFAAQAMDVTPDVGGQLSELERKALVDQRMRACAELFRIAGSGSVNKLIELISAGASVDCRGPNGDTPLISAVRSGNVLNAYFLLTAKAPVDTAVLPDRETALHIAAQKGDPKMARLLLDYNADPSLKAKFGETPLDFARGLKTDDKKSMINVLRKKALAAEETCKILEAKQAGTYALGKGIIDAAEELNKSVGYTMIDVISVGSSQQTTTPDQIQTPVSELEQKQIVERCKAGKEVYCAVVAGVISKLVELLRAGAPVDYRASNGDTPLICVVRKGDLMRAYLLLFHKAEVNAVATQDSETALHIAARLGNPKMVRLLLDFNADPNLKDRSGESPLDFARGLDRTKTKSRVSELRTKAQKAQEILTAFEEKQTDRYVPGKGIVDAAQELNNFVGYTMIEVSSMESK